MTTVVDLKVIEANHDARHVKARRTGEIDCTSPAKSMASGTREPPATKGDNDKENVPVPANWSSASSSSSAGPAPQPEAPEESVLRESTPDVKNNGPKVMEQLSK